MGHRLHAAAKWQQLTCRLRCRERRPRVLTLREQAKVVCSLVARRVVNILRNNFPKWQAVQEMAPVRVNWRAGVGSVHVQARTRRLGGGALLSLA